MTIEQLVFGSMYFFLPAGIANMSPSIATKLFGPGHPIDAGGTLGGKRLLGSHKTWQGIIVGTIVGFLFFLLQVWLYQFPFIKSLAIIDYSTAPLILGAALGFGALFGDLVKSFFKRQLDIKPGKSWLPFDQLDYVIGGMLFALPFVTLHWQEWTVIIFTYFALHIIVNLLGYSLGIKENML